MKTNNIFKSIIVLGISIVLTSCYGYRQVGLLQDRDDLPQYDSVAYEPYRLQVNDEVIYRVILQKLYQLIMQVVDSMPILIVFILMVPWIFHSFHL